MALCQKSIDALNLYGQHLLDKDIPITIIYSFPFYKTNKYVSCDGFMKSETNRY